MMISILIIFLIISSTKCFNKKQIRTYYHSLLLQNTYSIVHKSNSHRLQSTVIDRNSIEQSEVTIKDLIINGPIPEIDRKYLINGWRWHTMSVIRDIQRYIVIIHKKKDISNSDIRNLFDHIGIITYKLVLLLSIYNILVNYIF